MLLKTLFLEQIPDTARAVLAVVPASTDLDGLAAIADKIIENSVSNRSQFLTAPAQVAAVSTLTNPDEANGLKLEVRALRALVDTLVSELAHLRNQQQQRRSRSKSRQPRASTPNGDRLCWYHSKYGANANKCTNPCSYVKPSEN